MFTLEMHRKLHHLLSFFIIFSWCVRWNSYVQFALCKVCILRQYKFKYVKDCPCQTFVFLLWTDLVVHFAFGYSRLFRLQWLGYVAMFAQGTWFSKFHINIYLSYALSVKNNANKEAYISLRFSLSDIPQLRDRTSTWKIYTMLISSLFQFFFCLIERFTSAIIGKLSLSVYAGNQIYTMDQLNIEKLLKFPSWYI